MQQHSRQPSVPMIVLDRLCHVNKIVMTTDRGNSPLTGLTFLSLIFSKLPAVKDFKKNSSRFFTK